MDYMQTRLTVKRANNGEIAGYASVFDELDLGRDIVTKGAFNQSLKIHEQRGTAPAMLYGHDNADPIGRWTVLREDTKGLYVEGKIDLSQDSGQRAFDMVANKTLDGLSVGMVIEDHDPIEKGGKLIRKAYLAEISLVAVPSNQSSRISLKSARGLERLLRDNGYSRKEASAVVADGYGGIDPKHAQTAAAVARLTRMLTKSIKRLSE